MRIQFFAEILEDCLHRLDRGEDLQSVLERYPDHAERLRSLLAVAMVSRALPKPKPSPQALNQGIRTLLTRMNEIQNQGGFQAPEPAPQPVPIHARIRDWFGKITPSRWIPLPAPAQRMMMVGVLLVFVGGFATVGVSAASEYDLRFMAVRLNYEAIEQVINQLVQNQDRQLLDLPGMGRVKAESRSTGSTLKLPAGKHTTESTAEDPGPDEELPIKLQDLKLDVSSIKPDLSSLDRAEEEHQDELRDDLPDKLNEILLNPGDEDDDSEDREEEQEDQGADPRDVVPEHVKEELPPQAGGNPAPDPDSENEDQGADPRDVVPEHVKEKLPPQAGGNPEPDPESENENQGADPKDVVPEHVKEKLPPQAGGNPEPDPESEKENQGADPRDLVPDRVKEKLQIGRAHV